MDIISSQLNDVFLECVKTSQHSIKLCSPFVKQQTVDHIYNIKRDTVDLKLITNVNLHNLHKKSSDISALRTVVENNGIIYNFQRLHAKIYIFDNTYAIITSANLTPSGMKRNYEYGVFVNELGLVKQVCSDYDSVCFGESSGVISLSGIKEIEKMLSTFPEITDIPFTELSYEIDGLIDKALIDTYESLSGWKKLLFDALNSFDKRTFSANDYARTIPYLQSQYPNNNTVEAKIRQTLQQLRDVGLLKFEGNGVYTKLWKV